MVLPFTAEEAHVTFSAEGLLVSRTDWSEPALMPIFRLAAAERSRTAPPYRGLRPLEADDAGIFFGREAPIVEALDPLRGLREAAPPRLLVILGASGAGKSSFLRAGLFPRLARDDQNFLPLPIIRPERAAITGETGLLRALEGAFAAAQITIPRADLRAAIEGGAAKLKPLLQALAEKATPTALDDGCQTQAAYTGPVDRPGRGVVPRGGAGRGAAVPRLVARSCSSKTRPPSSRFSRSARTTTNGFNSPKNSKVCVRKCSACRPCRRAPMPR